LKIYTTDLIHSLLTLLITLNLKTSMKLVDRLSLNRSLTQIS
jgi:hypothetical protein